MMISRSDICFDPVTKYEISLSPLFRYSQSISYWARRFAQNNRSFFNHESDIVICSSYNIEKYRLKNKRAYYYFTNIKDYNKDKDNEEFNIIDFTGLMKGMCNPDRVIYIKPTCSIQDIQSICDIDKIDKSLFNITVFFNNEKELSDIINLWIDLKIVGNIYAFKSQHLSITSDFILKIEELNKANKCKNINIFSYENDAKLVVSALKNSIVSIFLEQELIYQFISIYLKCFPIIIKGDTLTSRFYHIDSEINIPALIISFVSNPKSLQSLIAEMNSFEFSSSDAMIPTMINEVLAHVSN